MPVYETQDVLRQVDDHTVIVMALCGMALIGNYLFWIENLVTGFRAKRFTMPIPCTAFFLAHDLTFVASYDKWFNEIDHWFPKLWWFGLILTSAMELAFLAQLLRYGRKELEPKLTQPQFVAAILAICAAAAVPWLVIKDVMADELFLVIFGCTVFWCTPFYLALQRRRRDAVGQSIRGWLAFLLMPLCYWPATYILSDGFHTVLWTALGVVTVLGALANIASIRQLNRVAAAQPLTTAGVS